MAIVHDSSWDVDAPREEVWAILHPQRDFDPKQTTLHNPRVIEFGNVRIEVLVEGDENGQGLVRRCWYEVPWYFGGKSRSWELVSEVRVPEIARYDALTMPPAAHAIGWHRLEDLGDGRTRVHFHEEYRMENRFLAFFFERAVHRFISKDNDINLKGIIDQGLKRRREAAA